MGRDSLAYGRLQARDRGGLVGWQGKGRSRLL